MDVAKLKELAKQELALAVTMTQEMIRVPSISGDEAAMAQLTQDYMLKLGYDEVAVDEVGNVLGLMRGTGSGGSVMFNCHLDTVAAGDPSVWKYPPYDGVVAEERVWGLGASDTKGAFACQIVAVAALKKAGLLPAGDIWVAGVVCEETAAFGSIYLSKQLKVDSVILGEASNNQLNIGHRGRILYHVNYTGKSTHASVPERGCNPHFSAARMILALENLRLGMDPLFGSSSFAPTLYSTDQSSSNVTPGKVKLTIDCRNIPTESEGYILEKLSELAGQNLSPGVTAEINVELYDVVCYNGYRGKAPAGEPSFVTPPDDDAVLRAHNALETALGHPVEVGMCGFATDGGHFRSKGSKVIVFAPAEERHCHTREDSISIAKMQEAIAGNMALAIELGR
jgi:putative selenium metabolism hydrolase